MVKTKRNKLAVWTASVCAFGMVDVYKRQDEVLGGLLPGADELRMLGRALLTLDNGKPLPAMDAPVGDVYKRQTDGCRKRGTRFAFPALFLLSCSEVSV